ncbi:MAG TPA: Ig-like domain-containing protein, partial [Fibrella sp.]
MALKSDGTVWAWGRNTAGELGNGSTGGFSAIPAQVLDSSGVALSGITAISAGGSHNLALKSDGTVWAWGRNTEGQLGKAVNGIYINPVPTQVDDLTGVTAIVAGAAYSMALKSDGTVWTWGQNGYGQLGNGSSGTYTNPVPTQVNDLTGVTTIGTGSMHALVLSTQVSSVPVVKDDSATTSKNAAVNIAVLNNDIDGDGGSLIVTAVGPTTSGGTVTINGSMVNYNATMVNYVPPTDYLGDDSFSYTITDAEGNTASATVTVSIYDNGNVVAWGKNYSGELGNNTTTDSPLPTPVSNLSGAVAVAAGSSHSLAIRSDGTVWAWGNNHYGQLGDNSTTQSKVPTQVSNLSGIVAIAAGANHSLALKSDGTVWGWGSIGWGSTLTMSSLVPVQVSGLNGVVSIAAGENHSLALKGDGTVWAWGGNEDYQFGNGNTTSSSEPVQVSGLGSIAAIAAGVGGSHSLALTNDGRVWTWGYTLNTKTPVLVVEPDFYNHNNVLTLNNVVAIAAGGNSGLALKSDGRIWNWAYYSRYAVSEPEAWPNLGGVIALTSGHQSMAIREDGTVWTTDYTSLTQIDSLNGVKAVASGRGFGLAILGSWSGAGDADDGLDGPSGTWSTNSNWASNRAPGANQVASIRLPGTYAVLLDENSATGTVQLGSRARDQGEVSLDLGGNTLTVTASGGAKVHESGTVTGSGTINGNLVSNGTIAPAPVVSSGVLSERSAAARSVGARSVGARSLSASSTTRDASLSSSNPGGTIVISGNITNSSTSQVTLVLSGSSEGQYDQCVANAYWYMGGTLDVQLATGFTPMAGQKFELLRAKTFVSDFQTKNIPEIAGLEITLQRIYNYNPAYPGTTSYVLVVSTPAPLITELSPSSGRSGDQVTLTGKYFTGASEVRFLGSDGSSSDDRIAALPQPGADFTDTLLKIEVPAGAATGLIRVTRDEKSGTTPSVFTIEPAPTILTFTPEAGPPGAIVTITGTNFTGTKVVAFNELSCGPMVSDISTAATGYQILSDTSIKAKVPPSATTGRISVTNAESTGTSADTFTVAPTITSFSPRQGTGGTVVTITGRNFLGVTTVKFNGVSAGDVVTDIFAVPAGFQIMSSTQIKVKVPASASTGLVSVTNAGGTATSSTTFLVFAKIISFTPASGRVGTLVTIKGTNFAGATATAFNGVDATFIIDSPAQITATVPPGATTGKISVGTIAGTTAGSAISSSDFTVLPPNKAPVGINDAATTTQSAGLDINVLANDSDPDKDLLTITAVTQGNSGQVEIIAGGAKLRYTPINGFVGEDTFTYTISDGFLTATASVTVNVRAVLLTINDVTLNEGNTGTTNATFTLALSTSSSLSVTVSYSTANGTTNPATSGSDYSTTSGTLTFNPGETNKSIKVPIVGDYLIEAGETFVVNLTAPTNATLADDQGTGTITNDDSDTTPPTLRFTTSATTPAG